MLKLDMSRFKKISGDKHHSVLEHDEGHTIKISHKALSKGIRQQLERLPVHKMAEGGEVSDDEIIAKKKEVDDYNNTHEDEPKEYPTDVQNVMYRTDVTPSRYAPGGEVEKKSDRGPAVDPKKAKEIQDSAIKSGWQPDAWKKNLKAGLGFAEGGDVEEAPKPPITINIGQSAPQTLPQVPADAQADQSNVIPAAQETQVGVPPQTPVQSAPEQPVASPIATLAPKEAMSEERPSQVVQQPGVEAPNLAHAYEQQQGTIAREGQVQANLAQEQEKQYLAHTAALTKLNTDFTGKVKELDDERKSLQDDIKNFKIDPNHYLGSMDTSKRVLTSIGLFLGGLGNHPNQAAEFVNRQIDRDIDAQRAQLGKKENLLSANFRQYGNLKDAMAMTKLMMTDLTQAQLASSAAKANSPMAKLRAEQLAGQLEAQTAPQMQQMAVNRMLMEAGAKDGGGEQMLGMLRVVNPALAKDLETRIVPGVGTATIPVPAEDRRNIVAKQTLHNMATEFYNWSKKHSGSLNPEQVNIGKTKAAELQSLYRNAINGGVFKKGEQEFIDQIIDSDPTKFFNNLRVLPKLKEVIGSNNQQLNTLKKSFGLPEGADAITSPKLNPQQESFVQWAKKNPNDPRSKLVLKKLGLEE